LFSPGHWRHVKARRQKKDDQNGCENNIEPTKNPYESCLRVLTRSRSQRNHSYDNVRAHHQADYLDHEFSPLLGFNRPNIPKNGSGVYIFKGMNMKCPHCGGSIVYDPGHSRQPAEYKCIHCGDNPEKGKPKTGQELFGRQSSGGGYSKAEPEIKNCLYCGEEFEDRTSRRDKKFCHPKCHHDYWNRKVHRYA